MELCYSLFKVFLHHSTHRSFHNISHPVARELAFLGTFSICAMDSFSFLGCSSNLLGFVGGVGRKTPTRFSQPDYPSRFEILILLLSTFQGLHIFASSVSIRFSCRCWERKDAVWNGRKVKCATQCCRGLQIFYFF